MIFKSLRYEFPIPKKGQISMENELVGAAESFLTASDPSEYLHNNPIACLDATNEFPPVQIPPEIKMLVNRIPDQILKG